MTQDEMALETTLEDFPKQHKVAIFLVLTLVGFLVYTLAGYNYFMDSTTRLIVKLLIPSILGVSSIFIKGRLDKKWFIISFSFFAVSLGFLFANFLGRWYLFIPGLIVDSVEGWAIAKFAEVLPIVATIIILLLVAGDSPTSLYIKGGDFKKTLVLGIVVVPLSFIQYLAMGGLAVNVASSVIISWIPWLIVFAFSNAFMEELIFRGVFLRKLEAVLGERTALLQISFVFAIMHLALLPFMGLELAIIFVLFLFVIGWSWGYIVQKSESIWGAVLAHAVADILFVIIAFGVV